MKLDDIVDTFDKYPKATKKLFEYMIINNVELYPIGKNLMVTKDKLVPDQSTILSLSRKNIKELDLYENKWHAYRLKMPTDWKNLTTKYHGLEKC